MIKGTASPDDPELNDYFERRIRSKAKGLPARKLVLARNQDHKCWRCGEDLDNGEEIQKHRINPTKGYTVRNTRLVHYYCHQQITAEQRREARRKKQGAAR
jgi:RNA-directed DNA polymerase